MLARSCPLAAQQLPALDGRLLVDRSGAAALSRKLKYISYPLREYYPEPGSDFPAPLFAEKILQDECCINPQPKPIPWEAMAIRAEEVMKRLHDELVTNGYPDHPPEGGCPPC